jgi:hypothetical protein
VQACVTNTKSTTSQNYQLKTETAPFQSPFKVKRRCPNLKKTFLERPEGLAVSKVLKRPGNEACDFEYLSHTRVENFTAADRTGSKPLVQAPTTHASGIRRRGAGVESCFSLCLIRVARLQEGRSVRRRHLVRGGIN